MPRDPMRYEVQNPEMQALLLKVAEQLGAKMPDGWGFTLLIFEYSPGSSMFYISSAQRQDIRTRCVSSSRNSRGTRARESGHRGALWRTAGAVDYRRNARSPSQIENLACENQSHTR